MRGEERNHAESGAIYDTHGNLPPLCGMEPDPTGGVDCLMRVTGDVRFGIRSLEFIPFKYSGHAMVLR
jgi:hypothetical protein